MTDCQHPNTYRADQQGHEVQVCKDCGEQVMGPGAVRVGCG
jgi:hypothetical protein